MDTIIIGDQPKNKLPRATGHDKWKNEYRFGPRNVRAGVVERNNSYLGGILKQAVLNPGKRVVMYNEENGYEYETYAIYDPAENNIITNWYGCPSSSGHHIGSTCGVCGLKD